MRGASFNNDLHMTLYEASETARPCMSITDHMRQIAATGDLTRKLPTTPQAGWEDEDAHTLATTFNMLTDSIVRSRRELIHRSSTVAVLGAGCASPAFINTSREAFHILFARSRPCWTR